jgi:hypothetical protein
MTRSELALAYRIPLLIALGFDGRCAECKRFLALEDAHIDHRDGRTWYCRSLNFLDRIRRQWREFERGVALRPVCVGCNSRDGATRLQGRPRYSVRR